MPRIPQLSRAQYFPDRRDQVAVVRQQGQADMGTHRHEFLEIVVILSGQGVHVTQGVRHEVRSGDVLVIHSSRSHAYENTRNLSLVNLLVHEKLLSEIEKELSSLPGFHALFTLEPVRWRQKGFTHHLRLGGDDLRQVVQWIDALEKETKRFVEGGRLLAQSWIILIIGLLARRYGRSEIHAPRLEMRLGRVLSWIEEHATEKLTTAGLARQAAMSERTFLRRFREATGLSPIDYVIRTRVRHAAQLLTAGDPGLSITEIAFRCGFQDSNYFSRQFRQVMGSSPRRWRNSA